MSTIEIKAFTTLREKLGEEATEVLMEYIGQKHASALSEDKARATFATEDRLRQVFATKEDLANTKVDILRWMFAMWVTLALAILGLYLKG